MPNALTRIKYRQFIEQGTGDKIYVGDKPKKIIEPLYFKTYSDVLSDMKDLNATCLLIMFELASRMDHKTNMVRITPTDRKQFCEIFKITINSCNSYLSLLNTKRFLMRVDTGNYIVNPLYFSKSDWRTVYSIILKINGQNTLNQIRL